LGLDVRAAVHDAGADARPVRELQEREWDCE
jgi:hypothetical protein